MGKSVELDDNVVKELLISREQELNPKVLTPDPSNPDYKSLGHIDLSRPDSEMPEVGWKNIPIENLPSKGLFYPQGGKVRIRAATGKEIRHFSTIDEDDFLDVDDKLNFIMDNCSRIILGDRNANYKDLLEIDRFYIIFSIRDYTFMKGENKVQMKIACNQCGNSDTIELTRERFKYFNLDERLMKYYDEKTGSFLIKTKSGESWNVYLPTLGVINFIKNYTRAKAMNREYIDKFSLKYSPFLFSDWRRLTEGTYKGIEDDSVGWSLEKISIFDMLVGMLNKSINLEIMNTCSSCGAEVSAPISFQGGIKSLFLLADPFERLQ